MPRLEAIQVIRVCARRLETFHLLQWINWRRSEQINPILYVQFGQNEIYSIIDHLGTKMRYYPQTDGSYYVGWKRMS